MFYLILAFILFLGALWYIYKGKPISKRTKSVLFMCFWLVAGLAYQTGVDWRVYGTIFEQVIPIHQSLIKVRFYEQYSGVSTEPGYSLLSSLVVTFTNEYQVLQILTLLIASIFFFKSLSKYTNNYFIALLLYLGYVYLTLNMSGVRQAVSLSIVFYALQFVEQRRFWRFLLFILLATSFHYSSLIMLPLYWVLNRKIETKWIFILISVGLVAYVARISMISSTIERLTESVGSPVMYRLYLYATGAQDAILRLSPKMFLNVILFVMLLLRRNILIEQSRYSNIFINLFLIYILFGQYMWDTGDIVVRIQHYFIMGLVVMIPIYIESLKYMGNKIILTCFAFVLSIWSSNPIFLELPTGLPYNPYQNYIMYQIIGKPSTGEERLKEWNSENGE